MDGTKGYKNKRALISILIMYHTISLLNSQHVVSYPRIEIEH